MDTNTALSRLRRPEYTGDQRCWPCTVVNLGILGGVAGTLALAGAPVVAAGVGLLGTGAIWLRGYLVPGTPAIAPRLVAAVPGGETLFKRESGSPVPDGAQRGSLGESEEGPGADELLGTLIEAGVVVPDGEELFLDSAFEEGWDETMSSLSSLSTQALAAEVAGVSAASETRAERDDGTGQEWIAVSDGDHFLEEVWVSRPVAIAATAALRRLAGYVGDQAIRRAAASSLRMFLAECPDCGTPLEESTAVSCCGGYHGENEVPEETLVCPSCDVRLFTFD